MAAVHTEVLIFIVGRSFLGSASYGIISRMLKFDAKTKITHQMIMKTITSIIVLAVALVYSVGLLTMIVVAYNHELYFLSFPMLICFLAVWRFLRHFLVLLTRCRRHNLIDASRAATGFSASGTNFKDLLWLHS